MESRTASLHLSFVMESLANLKLIVSALEFFIESLESHNFFVHVVIPEYEVIKKAALRPD